MPLLSNIDRFYLGSVALSKAYRGGVELWQRLADIAASISATGGTITDADGYRYHTFTASDDFVVTSGGEVEYLVVAGGGGTGPRIQGGGGAGGLLTGSESIIPGTFPVVIGAGGPRAPTTEQSSAGGPGSDSSALSHSSTGGGRGGTSTSSAGGPGGSGGGARGNNNSLGGAGVAGQGTQGARAYSFRGGGGGGGKSLPGGEPPLPTVEAVDYPGGNGGDGLEVWGSWYAGGGGAGSGSMSGLPPTTTTGGQGGGGDGGNTSSVPGGDGVPNTGGGGGGGGFTDQANALGGNGGSGIVVIRYPLITYAAISGGDSIYTLNGWTYHEFTASGDLTVTSAGEVEVLAVAGGGGGGYRHGAGGGAGGVVFQQNYLVSTGIHAVSIGAGGAGATGSTVRSVNGSDSSLVAVSALGGGGGGQWDGFKDGLAGGSGGGTAGSTPGAGTAGQGNSGGGSMAASPYNWGGGGGAGTVGQTGTTTTIGDGGIGVDYSSIFGTGVGEQGWFGGGGGGGSHDPAPTDGQTAAGGMGGGGDGAPPSIASGSGVSGMPNTGGGGGGASTDGGGTGLGGTGGSGIVIVRTRFVPTDIQWHTALWADDITGLSDGELVTAWYDSTGSGRVTEPHNANPAPTYVASDAKFNGRPSVFFNASEAIKVPLGELLGADRDAFLVMAYDEIISGNQYLIEGGSATSQRNYFAAIGTSFQVGRVSGFSLAAGDTAAHAISYRNGAQRFDSIETSGNLGVNNQNQITIGSYIADSAQYRVRGRLVFYGVINRNLTAEEKTILHQWAIDYYGTPA